MSGLRAELERARWYQGKGGELASILLRRHVRRPGRRRGLLAILAAEYTDGGAAEYAMAGAGRA